MRLGRGFASNRRAIDREIEAAVRAEKADREARARAALEEHRTQAPAVRQAKADAHQGADLKARYGDCGEVLWSLSGDWLPVIRWNAKSVTVDMSGSRESIPHTQVAGARRELSTELSTGHAPSKSPVIPDVAS